MPTKSIYNPAGLAEISLGPVYLEAIFWLDPPPPSPLSSSLQYLQIQREAERPEHWPGQTLIERPVQDGPGNDKLAYSFIMGTL